MFKRVLIISGLFIYTINAPAEIYKWVDEQGKIHYGDRAQVNSTEMDIVVTKKANVKISESREIKRQKLLDAYAEDNKRETKEKEELKKQKKKLERNCAYSKDRIRRYERARSLYNLDKDGNRITMSDEERQKAVSGLKKDIKKHCK